MRSRGQNPPVPVLSFRREPTLRRLAYLWPYLRPHRRKLFLGLASILASVLIGLLGPLLVGSAVDAVRRGVTSAMLLGYAGLLVGIALSRALQLSPAHDPGGDEPGHRVRDAQPLLRSLEKQPPAFFHDHPTGDLMARATNDLQAVRMLCGPAIMYGANTLFTGIGCLFFMVRINAVLTAICPDRDPPGGRSPRSLSGAGSTPLFSSVQGRFSDISARVQESLAGVRVVRAYAQEEREEEEFQRVNQEYLEGNRRLAFWSTAIHPLLQMLIGLGFVAVLWYGGLLVIRGAHHGGRVRLLQFLPQQADLADDRHRLGGQPGPARPASLARIREVLDTEPAIRDEEPLVDPGTDPGATSPSGT